MYKILLLLIETLNGHFLPGFWNDFLKIFCDACYVTGMLPEWAYISTINMKTHA